MTDEQTPKSPEPRGRFQKWLELVLAHATVQEAATRKEQSEVDEAFDRPCETPSE